MNKIYDYFSITVFVINLTVLTRYSIAPISNTRKFLSYGPDTVFRVQNKKEAELSFSIKLK